MLSADSSSTGNYIAQVPTAEISPNSKHWWTKELTILCRIMIKLGRKASKLRNCPSDKTHIEYKDSKTNM
jgi:hypothetical protein